MMQLELKEEFTRINFIIIGKNCFIDASYKPQILLTCLVFILKLTPVMVMGSIVKHLLISDSYEMYRDFQENTINSDGSFGMWIVYIAAVYLIHEMYNYFLPWYWNKTAYCKNG